MKCAVTSSVPTGRKTISHFSPALNAPGYYQTPLRGGWDAPASTETKPKTKDQGQIPGWISALSFGVRENYWPDARDAVPALAICFSVACDGTGKCSVMPNS